MKETEVKRSILRVENGKARYTEDRIVTEHPITIKINGEEFVTLVCTPEYMEDMAIGYLASAGLIRRYEDIEEMWIQEEEGFIHVKASKLNPYTQNFQSKRYVTSCCGMSRQGFVFVNDAMTAKKMTGMHVALSPEDCYRLMREMQQSAELFHGTGGVHNAALCDKEGIILSRMDIGRHNALDKIYGHCIRHDISINDKVLVFSGRLSSEILLKVAKIGCEVVLTKSAPTELAVQLADQLGITAVGFIRHESMNVYTHPERIHVQVHEGHSEK